MSKDGLTNEDVRRINGFGVEVEALARATNHIESGDAGPHHGWWWWHDNRLLDARYAAIYNWFVIESSVVARNCLQEGGESSLVLMRDIDYPEPEQMAYVDGKFHKLTQKKDGTWSHHSREAQQMLESRIADMNALEEDLMPDLSRSFVLVQHYSRIPENAIPGMECALGSGDMELARQVAEFAGSVGDFVFPKSLAYYSRVLKYATLGDTERFNKALDGLEKGPKKAPYQELGRAYAGMMSGDEPATKKSFQVYVNWFSKKRKITKTYYRRNQEIDSDEPFEKIPDEFYFSFAGLAFCNLAASRGIEIEVDKPFLPKALLISRSGSN